MTMVYKAKEVAKLLNLSESTFKKYYLELEQQGYTFQRDGRTLIFSEDDVITFEKFVELIQYDGMTIPLVAKRIAEAKGHNEITEPKQSYDVMALVEKAVTTALEQQQKQVNDVITTLATQNQELQQEMKRMAERHDKMLTESLKASMENKKLLLEVQQEVSAAREENKKSIWQRWFGK